MYNNEELIEHANLYMERTKRKSLEIDKNKNVLDKNEKKSETNS